MTHSAIWGTFASLSCLGADSYAPGERSAANLAATADPLLAKEKKMQTVQKSDLQPDGGGVAASAAATGAGLASGPPASTMQPEDSLVAELDGLSLQSPAAQLEAAQAANHMAAPPAAATSILAEPQYAETAAAAARRHAEPSALVEHTPAGNFSSRQPAVNADTSISPRPRILLPAASPQQASREATDSDAVSLLLDRIPAHAPTQSYAAHAATMADTAGTESPPRPEIKDDGGTEEVQQQAAQPSAAEAPVIAASAQTQTPKHTPIKVRLMIPAAAVSTIADKPSAGNASASHVEVDSEPDSAAKCSIDQPLPALCTERSSVSPSTLPSQVSMTKDAAQELAEQLQVLLIAAPG